jgi:lipopolysaccharide transport system permease protein
VHGTDEYEITLRPDNSWLSLELRSLWQYRDLLAMFVWRDFVAKYKQTILGPLWFVVQPLLVTVVFTIVFGKLINLSTDGLPPLLFYLCGQLGWTYFAQSFTASATTLVSNAALFSKVYFPRLIVPLAALVSNLFAFATQAVIFVVFFIAFKFVLKSGTFGLTWQVVFLPLVVLQSAALSLGVGLVMSALTAKYRDLTHLLTVLVQVWMYATPVIYPLSEFPVRWRWVAALNPMTPIMESYRFMLLGAGLVNLRYIGWSAAITLGLVVSGLLLFERIEKTFVDTI